MKKQRQKVENASPSSTPRIETVLVSNIIVEPSFQSTNRDDRRVVKEYAGKIDAGVDITLIDLAEVNGSLVLIDGFHRLEAYKALGWDEVEARVTPITEHGARMAAIKANTTNSLHLNDKQKWEKVERAYKMGWYKDENDMARKFEDMAADINYIRTAKQISAWMFKYHKKTYNWIMKGRKKQRKFKGGGGGMREPKGQPQETAIELGNRALLAFYSDKSPSSREETAEHYQELAEKMTSYGLQEDDEIANEDF